MTPVSDDPVHKLMKKSKRKNRVSINLTLCKYEVVRKIARARGWKLITDEQDKNRIASCNLHWIDVPEFCDTFRRLQPYQKVNHFPGMSNVLARKSKLARSFERMKKLYPKDYDFCPKTWILPFDLRDFSLQFNQEGKSQKTFIIKPDHMCQGRGVYLTKQLQQLQTADIVVAQQYISKPLLLDNKKFDLRIYVLVTSCDPLRVYLFQDGLVRLCTADYVTPNGGNLDQRFMHLTNYAVNKHSSEFEMNQDNQQDGFGNKRSLRWFFKWLKEQYNVEQVEKLWDQIGDICLKAILAVQPVLAQEYRSAFAKYGQHRKSASSDLSAFSDDTKPDNQINRPRPQSASSVPQLELNESETGSSCFSVLGMDVLVDEGLKPWLLEVNHLPSFGCDSPLDWNVKERLISQVFDVLGVSPDDQKSWERQKMKSSRTRLYGTQSDTLLNDRNPRDSTASDLTECLNQDVERSDDNRCLTHMQLRSALMEYYEQVNPERLSDVDMIVDKFHGRQDALNASLVDKYGHGIQELKQRPASSTSSRSSSSSHRRRKDANACKQIPLIDFVQLYPSSSIARNEKFQEILEMAEKGVKEQQMRFVEPLQHRRNEDGSHSLPPLRGAKNQGRDCFGIVGTDKARCLALSDREKKPSISPHPEQVATAHRMMLGYSSQLLDIRPPTPPSNVAKPQRETVNYGLQYRERLAIVKLKPTLTMAQVTFGSFD